MRAFSELEKQLIHRMIELDDKAGSLNCLNNIINHFYGKSHLPDYCYIELKAENNVSIHIKTDVLNKSDADWLNAVDKDISKKLLSIVALFKYLETQTLAYFVGGLESNSLGTKWDETDYTKCNFLDTDLKPVIFEYARKKIFVSETLRVFVNNGFKTDEEIRQEKEILTIAKQLKYTRIALVITFIGLISSILVPNLVVSNINIKNDRIITELNPKTIGATQEALNEGIKPVIQELISTQEKLTVISDSIQQAAELRSLKEQNPSVSVEKN